MYQVWCQWLQRLQNVPIFSNDDDIGSQVSQKLGKVSWTHLGTLTHKFRQHLWNNTYFRWIFKALGDILWPYRVVKTNPEPHTGKMWKSAYPRNSHMLAFLAWPPTSTPTSNMHVVTNIHTHIHPPNNGQISSVWPSFTQCIRTGLSHILLYKHYTNNTIN
jgi:hypothetical protein